MTAALPLALAAALTLAYGLSPAATGIWVVVGLLGMIGSAVFSGLETGIYRLNRVRLHLLAHRHEPRAVILDRMDRNPNRTLGTLLIGNNIANYASSLGITALLGAAGLGDRAIIIVVALILTPLLFVFGEVLPKDLFQNYTDRITYSFARFLRLTQWLLTATLLLPIVDGASRLIAWATGRGQATRLAVHPRRIVGQLISEGVGEGLISPYQSEMIERVLHPPESTVADAMVPWAQVHVVHAGAPPEAVWALADRVPHSRFPVVDASGQPAGALHVFDVMLREPTTCPPLESLMRPAPWIDPRLPLRQALGELRLEHSAMGFVGSPDQPLGIITVKDIVEPITGELATW